MGRISALLDEKAFPLRQSQLTDQGWQLEPPEVMALLRKLRHCGKPLGEYVGGKFYRGIITGLNEAFVLTNEQRKALIAEDPKSEELIKPYLRGKDVKRWRVHHDDLFLIVVPFGFHKKLKDYPSILHHLEQFEEKLKNRGQCTSSRSGKGEGQHHWLELDNNPKPEYLGIFDGPKVFIPAIQYRLMAAFVEHPTVINNKASVFHCEDARYCAAIINSTVSWWLATLVFSTKQNNNFDFEPRYSKQFPIPPASETVKARLAELAEACADAAKRDDKDSLRSLEAEIDRIVYRLFDLTYSDIRMIEGEHSHLPGRLPEHGEPSKRDRVHRVLVYLCARQPYVHMDKVREELQGRDISDELIKEYISGAMSEGLVYDSGRGWYSALENPAWINDELTEKLTRPLKEHFPRLPMRIWSTAQLNPWLEHLIGTPIHLVVTEADFTGDVAEYLEEKGWTVYHNPTSKRGTSVQAGSQSVVIRPVRSELDFDEPGPEDFLVDLWRENKKTGFLSQPEMESAILAFVSQGRVNLGNLLRLFERNFPNESFLQIEYNPPTSKN